MSSTYKEAGVDIDAMNLAVKRMRDHVRTTYTPGVLTDVGSFGGMFALDWKSFEDPILVSSIDGVGTKVSLAAMANRHDTIGADLVSHCVNDILVQGAAPLFFMDYFATGGLDADVVEQVVAGVARGCRAVGCALLGGETAEMPGLYKAGDYDLAGCIVGVVDRPNIVDGKSICPGDVVLGLASDGLHTNGYSLARKVLLEKSCIALSECPPDLGGVSLADALLAPHRCYANALLPLVGKRLIKGMAHITGGGFTDNIPRVLPEGCSVRIDRSSWEVPAIFRLIQSSGRIEEPEMFRTFNMGIGMVVMVASEHAADVSVALAASGETVVQLGMVVEGDGTVLGI